MAINNVPHNQILLLIIQWLKRQWLPGGYPEPDPNQPADPVAMDNAAAAAFAAAKFQAAVIYRVGQSNANLAGYNTDLIQINMAEQGWIQKQITITG